MCVAYVYLCMYSYLALTGAAPEKSEEKGNQDTIYSLLILPSPSLQHEATVRISSSVLTSGYRWIRVGSSTF